MSLGAAGVLKYYGCSLIGTLKKVYPEHAWNEWEFQQVSRKFWSDLPAVREYMNWLAERLGISTLEDWYMVTNEQVIRNYGASLLGRYGTFFKALQACFPEHDWDIRKYNNPGTKVSKWGKSQYFLFQLLKEILTVVGVQEQDMQRNFKHPDLLFENNNKGRMELDIFIPKLSLAVEFQGQQHFQPHYIFGSFATQQFKDNQKRAACSRAGITLIEIPYWWDKTKQSLAATIQQQRPDLGLQIDPLWMPIPTQPLSLKEETIEPLESGPTLGVSGEIQ
jgi:hypothetical protein